MSCSRTQHGGGRFRTPDLSLRSPTLYHWATALPPWNVFFTLFDFYGFSEQFCSFWAEPIKQVGSKWNGLTENLFLWNDRHKLVKKHLLLSFGRCCWGECDFLLFPYIFITVIIELLQSLITRLFKHGSIGTLKMRNQFWILIDFFLFFASEVKVEQYMRHNSFSSSFSLYTINVINLKSQKEKVFLAYSTGISAWLTKEMTLGTTLVLDVRIKTCL